MADIFAISTASKVLQADINGKASAVYTVTNTSSKPVRGIAKVMPLESTREEWLVLEGEAERDFATNGTQQFVVNFSKPGGPVAPGTAASPQKFPFRLNVASARNPDEQFTEGPIVNVEVAPMGQKPPKKPFPWWIIFIIIIGILVIVGIGSFLAFCGKPEAKPAGKPDSAPGKFAGIWAKGNGPTIIQSAPVFIPTRFEIEQTGNELKVHAFNNCFPPPDCDMGIVTGSVVGDEGRVLIDNGMVFHTLVITEGGPGELKVKVQTLYRYNMGARPQEVPQEFSLIKQTPVAAPAP